MIEPQSRFVTLDGEPYHYLDFGGEGLPPLVFLHGTGLHAWTWLTHAHELAGRFHVYAFDHRGHGESTKARTTYGWGEMADDLGAFLSLLQLEKPLCVGHSMGATTVILAEARHPGRVGRAVLIDPIILPQHYYHDAASELTHALAAKTLKRRWVWDSREQMIATYEKKPPFKSWRHDQLELYVNHGTENCEGGVRLICPPAIEAQCYLGGHAVDPWPLLPSLQIPILILRGTNPETRTAVPLEEAAALLQTAELLSVSEAGHFLPMEMPEFVTASIQSFDKKTDERG